MNSQVTLFVILFIIIQVQSATIPVNEFQNEGEGLQDSSSRLYLAEHPYFENTIVGATMKKNLKKLCEQCKHSPLCRGKEDCEHCAKYCQTYGPETKENMMASSMEEEVGIAREPENDFMRNEGEKDTTLVSRFADSEMASNGMSAGLEQEDRVRMVHEPMSEEMNEEVVVDNHRQLEEGRDAVLNHNHQESRYYTAGVIKPGLLMNILLKLINIKQTNDIEKAVILVKSKKPVAVGMGEEMQTEFLEMLRKELETSEKIHGKSPLDSKAINKILETAYEKGEFKSRSRSNPEVVRELDSIPKIHNEKINRFNDKIVSSPSEMEINSKQFEASSEMMNHAESDRRTGSPSTMHEETNNKLRNDEQSNRNMMVSQSLQGENSFSNNQEQESGMERDSDDDESLEENSKARTLHKKKYKNKKKKKEQQYSYGHSYGSNYNQHYGYYRSSDDQTNNAGRPSDLQTDNQESLEALTGIQQENLASLNEDHKTIKDDWQRGQNKGVINKGEGTLLKDSEKSQRSRNDEDLIGAQQEGLRPLNEDRISAKDDWQRDQKGKIYKGEGGLLKDLEKSQQTRNDEDLIGAQQEGLRPLNEDSTGTKNDWQRDQKDFIFKGEGGQHEDLEKSHKQRSDVRLTNSQQDNTELLSEDIIGAKNNWQMERNGPVHEVRPGQLGERAESHETRNNEALVDEDSMEDSFGDSARRADEGIAQIHLSEKNKSLDPKKVSIAEPYEDSHDGIPDPFHTRIHTHFKKIQEYFNEKSGTPTGTPVSADTKDDNSPSGVMMQARNQKEDSESINEKQSSFEKDNLQMVNNVETKEEMFSKNESPDVKQEPMDDIPNVGINFQPEDLINLQMAKEEPMDETPKVGDNIQPQDLIILQKSMKNGNLNRQDMNFEGSLNMEHTDIESPKVKAAAPTKSIVVTGDLDEQEVPTKRPQFNNGEDNLPGQTVIQVDDQLIDVPDEGDSIFQVNSQHLVDNDQGQENIDMNQPDVEGAENIGAMRMVPNLSVNPQVMTDHSGQNLGLSAKHIKSESTHTNYPIPNQIPIEPSHSFKKEKELRDSRMVYAGNGDVERSSATDIAEASEQAFPTPKKSPIKKHPFAPAFAGFRAAKIIETGAAGSERSFASENLEETPSTVSEMNVVADKGTEIVGSENKEFETAIEKKIEKLITPREQDFLHNFGKIVPAVEKMHLNSKSDIYFMGNGIKLPLKMSPNHDGSLSLSVDLEKLCKCKNSTCAHKMEIINKLDGNLMDLSNYENSENSPKGKHENDVYNIENHSEKKIRKPRNHVDLSKLYKSYRRKHHKLHRRSVSGDYFRRFKEIEQSLEEKLDDLNENVKKSNKEYDNMLRKGTKDLLQIKEEDQVVKHRIELVNDLLKWMKEMASEANNVEDKNKARIQ